MPYQYVREPLTADEVLARLLALNLNRPAVGGPAAVVETEAADLD